MASIGIIANPASGKDIRRLVSYATTFDNNEKVNIVKRIMLGAQGMGIDKMYFLSDSFENAQVAIKTLHQHEKLYTHCEVVKIFINSTMEDTVVTAKKMEELGVGCIVVLGGDGTSRAVAKGITDTPILAISTGTNNVYPVMTEATVAGMAAAASARIGDVNKTCIRDKRIEVYVNDELKDIALIDAVISNDFFVGNKAIWDIDRIQNLFVTRCHPASIGFSSIAGCIEIVSDTDDYGYHVTLAKAGQHVKAPVAAGVIQELAFSQAGPLPLDTPYSVDVKQNCMISLDGERELIVRQGEKLSFVVTKNGPYRVKINETLELAKQLGFYDDDIYTSSMTSKSSGT